MFRFPFGWGELWGIADRTDFDLKQHMEHSGEDFTYIDPVSNERYVPYCIEPSLGADRVTLAFLCDAYEEEQLEGDDTRTVLRFHPALAPFKAAVLPLSKKLSEEAGDVWAELRKAFPVDGKSTDHHERQRQKPLEKIFHATPLPRPFVVLPPI